MGKYNEFPALSCLTYLDLLVTKLEKIDELISYFSTPL